MQFAKWMVSENRLLHSDRFGQIPRSIDIECSLFGPIKRQHLKRHNIDNALQPIVADRRQDQLPPVFGETER